MAFLHMYNKHDSMVCQSMVNTRIQGGAFMVWFFNQRGR